MAWITNSKCLFPTIVIIAVLVNRGLRLKNLLQPYEHMNFNDQNCKLKGSFKGAEDMGLGKNSILFIGASGGLKQCFQHGSSSAENGGIWMMNMLESDPEPVQIHINGYPNEQIHVHGIFVSNKTDRLYLINHLGPQSVVEVVQINYTPSISLQYLKTVKSPLFPRYGINDVVEGIDENEIYVTRWQVLPFPENGLKNPKTFVERMQRLAFFAPAFLGITMTNVFRCDLKKDECSEATDKIFIGANGMTTSTDRQHYFVADPVEKKFGVFKRQDNGRLELERWVQLPFGIDNLEFDTQTGEILMGTIPDMLSAIQSDSNSDIIVPGGLSIAYMEKGEWNVKDVLMHDGSKLSQISAGNRFRDTIVLGSPYELGILVCNV